MIAKTLADATAINSVFGKQFLALFRYVRRCLDCLRSVERFGAGTTINTRSVAFALSETAKFVFVLCSTIE
jgi:hypothetical protein